MLTETQFKEIYSRYRLSGLSIRSFCMNEGMNEAKFYYWQKRLRQFLPGSSGFIPVKVAGNNEGLLPSDHAVSNNVFCTSTGRSDSEHSFEITYPNGTRLKFSGPVDYDLIKSLLLLNR